MHTQIDATTSKPHMTSRLTHVLFVLLAIGSLAFVTACGEEPTPAERVENAAEKLGDGVEDAVDELRDRSTLEKIGDSVEELGEDIQDAAD